MRKYGSLILFLLVTLGGGSLIGFFVRPGEWYAALEKPWFNPPDWVFGPVWSVLYAMIAAAGWLVWRRDPTSPAMRVWIVQLILNFAWTPIFFGAHMIGLALIIIVALLVAIAAFIALARERDPVAALLFMPYALWVGYASALTAAILVLNR